MKKKIREKVENASVSEQASLISGGIKYGLFFSK